MASRMYGGLVSRVPVHFEGDGGGVGELSWGQREMWGNIHRCTDTQITLAGVAPLPPDSTVENMAAVFGYMLGRHQSLRTRIGSDNTGRLRQVVAERGETHLEVVDTDGVDPAEVAEVVHVRLRETKFDFAQDWPMRMAVVRHRGVLTHIVGAYSHLAVDGTGMDVMVADLASRDPDTGMARYPVTALQPLEQAQRQSTPAMRKRSETAMRYWESMLRSAPTRRFPDGGGRPDGGYAHATFSSPAVWAASRILAAGRQVSTATVLLAAFAVAMARVSGRNPSLTQVLVANRFRPGLAESVSTLSQAGLCVIDVAGIGFDEVIGRAWQASTNAYKYAYYDSTRRDELVAALGRERGEPFDLSCVLNDLRAPDPAMMDPVALSESGLRALVSHSRLHWLDQSYAGERLFISFDDLPDPGIDEVPDSVYLKAHADTRYLSRSDLEACLRGIETVLVEAVLHTTKP